MVFFTMDMYKKIKALKLQPNWTTLLAFTAKSDNSRSVKLKMIPSRPDRVLVPRRTSLMYRTHHQQQQYQQQQRTKMVLLYIRSNYNTRSNVQCTMNNKNEELI